MNKPIKRVQEMQGVSRDHHHALLLVWKINQGIDKKISPRRIIDYVSWFRKVHLIPHFVLEEKWIFPILGAEHVKVKQALQEHTELLELSLQLSGYPELNLFAEKLKNHVRFEERILFQKIQSVASSDQLTLIEKHHQDDNFCERKEDEFWL